MIEQQNIKTIQEVYAAFGRGDDAVTRWVSHFDSVVPWSGDFFRKRPHSAVLRGDFAVRGCGSI